LNNYTPLAYNKHRYELLNHRYHIFPIPASWSYQWALYADKQDPSRHYLHMNLHYHYNNNIEQVPGMEEVNRELTYLRRQYGNTPIFVTGDYNCQRTHPNFEVMIKGLSMESGVLVAEDVEPDGDRYWCHEPDTTVPQSSCGAIDHICVTTDLVNVKLHRVLNDELLCKSSDHCARFLDIEIKEKTV
jgi:endonuclease/exonuclease/phosphatase family metal-dependent hydrolase